MTFLHHLFDIQFTSQSIIFYHNWTRVNYCFLAFKNNGPVVFVSRISLPRHPRILRNNIKFMSTSNDNFNLIIFFLRPVITRIINILTSMLYFFESPNEFMAVTLQMGSIAFKNCPIMKTAFSPCRRSIPDMVRDSTW